MIETIDECWVIFDSKTGKGYGPFTNPIDAARYDDQHLQLTMATYIYVERPKEDERY